jgi:choline-sulfatase
MDVTEEMRQRWDGVAFPEPVAPGTFAGDHQEVRRRYAAMIENIDARVGELLARLDAEGELANTVVIYTSDHGEMLGDHGTWGKQVPLEASTRIPLVVAGPGVRAGARTDALVSLEDIGATALALAGLAPSAGMTAQPFTSVLAGESDAARPHLLSGLDRTAKEIEMAARHYGSTTWTRLRGWRSIVTGDRKLVVSADLPEPVLLDISDGRDEPVAARPGEVEHLLAALQAAGVEPTTTESAPV